jgi:hypothetical protein
VGDGWNVVMQNAKCKMQNAKCEMRYANDYEPAKYSGRSDLVSRRISRIA